MLKDEISNIFIVGIITGAVFYSLFGDRLAFLSEYMTAFTIFGLFVVLFLYILSLKIKTYVKLKQDQNLDELITFLTEKQINSDYLVNFFIGLSILIIPLFSFNFHLEDIVQSVGATLYYFIWHRLIYKKKQAAVDSVSLNKHDRLMDEVVIFLMPIFILLLAIIVDKIDMIDFVQVLVVFVLAITQHKITFNRVK